MGKKWIYRHKKEDFAHVAQSPNVDDMRKAHNSTTSGPSCKQQTTTEPAQASR